MRSPVVVAALHAALLGAGSAFAQEPPAPPAPAADVVQPAEPGRDLHGAVPQMAYAVSAFGVPRLTAGVAGFGGPAGGLAAARGTQMIGGGRLWASPVDRLTLVLEVDRRIDDKGTAAPSAMVLVRLLGGRADGWALAASGRYRTDGFNDLGGEVELGALFSAERRGWHADTNVVFGTSTDGGEQDGEVKLRMGYDVARWLRLGVDAQMRYRLAGDTPLPGGRLGDAVGGPEAVVAFHHFFVGALAGPSTVGVARDVGWTARLTAGAAAF